MDECTHAYKYIKDMRVLVNICFCLCTTIHTLIYCEQWIVQYSISTFKWLT